MSDISVLVVDDETSVLKAISTVLKHEQIDVTCAQSSKDAFDYLDTQSFDIILLDIMMPEQDGFSFLKELREHQILTPVILLSGREEDTAQVEGLGLGADDYMTKPFSKTVLVSKIRAIVRRSQQYSSASPSSPQSIQTEVQCGNFTLHLDTQTVFKFLYLPRNFPCSVSLLKTKKSCSVSRKSFPKYGRVMHQITILFWYILKDSVIKSRKTLPIQNILLPFGEKGINFFRKKTGDTLMYLQFL